MNKKHRELAENQARLEERVARMSAALEQRERERWWTRTGVLGPMILMVITLGVTAFFGIRELRQNDLENVISAAPIIAGTPEEQRELVDSAFASMGSHELAGIVQRGREPQIRSSPRSPPTPVLRGLMRSDSGKVDSAVAQLAAAASPIIPMDSAGNPYVRGADGRARIQIAAAEPAASPGAGAVGGEGFGGGSGKKGLWIGPSGELICAGICAPGQVCCVDLSGIQQ